MGLKIHLGGKLVDEADAKISVFDHGLLYGDGVFEGIRVYGGRVFLHRQHIDRLYESAKAIRLTIPLQPDELIAAVEETVKANNIGDGYVRLVVTRGAGSLGLDIRKTSNPQVIVIADTITLYPPETYTKGMHLVTASTIRNHPNAVNPRIKSLNYLNNILARIEGTDAGMVEALMLNHKGEVAECTGDNIFIVKLSKPFSTNTAKPASSTRLRMRALRPPGRPRGCRGLVMAAAPGRWLFGITGRGTTKEITQNYLR